MCLEKSLTVKLSELMLKGKIGSIGGTKAPCSVAMITTTGQNKGMMIAESNTEGS